MERQLFGTVGGIGSIETHDIVGLILGPDTSTEDSIASLFGFYIENHGANVAQELAADKFIRVVLTVEPILDEQSLRKPARQITHVVHLGDGSFQRSEEARVVKKSFLLALVCQIQFAEKVFVALRNECEFIAAIEILDVGFDQRMEVFQPFGHRVFVLDDLIEDLIRR